MLLMMVLLPSAIAQEVMEKTFLSVLLYSMLATSLNRADSKESGSLYTDRVGHLSFSETFIIGIQPRIGTSLPTIF